MGHKVANKFSDANYFGLQKGFFLVNLAGQYKLQNFARTKSSTSI